MSYVLTQDKRQAYILRLPGKFEKELQLALVNNAINLGWAKATGLTNNTLCYEDFREIIHNAYFPAEEDYRSSGRKAGNAWRFIHEMERGNYVLIPSKKGLYIGKVDSAPYFEDSFIEAERGYKRRICWLNNGKQIPLKNVPRKLQRKCKSSQSVTKADNLLQEIEFSLRAVQ
ncbi:MAG: hypothetical protein ACFFDW_11765 [Candidatus Thorarchaeota archaeon]